MILRYFAALSAKPEITYVQSNTLTSSTANTATYSIVIAGPVSCVVGFKVTIYTFFGGGEEMSIDSTDYVLNDTFNATLDSMTGLVTLTQFLKINNSPGNRINVTITIETVSKGVVSSFSNSWTNYISL